MNNLIQTYNSNILYLYNDLLNSEKELSLKNISKIFEYYSCIQLMNEFNKPFYLLEDISPDFKEQNQMTKSDSGIDACDLVDTIVQCKLRDKYLNWGECSTTFGSMIWFDDKISKSQVRWNLILTRNKECKLSANLNQKSKLFIDKTYPKEEIIQYCQNLNFKIIPNNPLTIERLDRITKGLTDKGVKTSSYENTFNFPISDKNRILRNLTSSENKNYDFDLDLSMIEKVENKEIELRDYQIECIELIKNNNQNIIISLPTGTGKNIVIINSIEMNKKYLILVPRIILMHQLEEEIMKYRSELKYKIQKVGDKEDTIDESKDIVICIYDSVHKIKNIDFEKIFVDEAHNVKKPEIYSKEESDTSEDENISEVSPITIEDRDKNKLIKKKYMSIINSFTEFNNNVYLSATIDEEDGFLYYKKDIREMIEKGYLCDYQIKIPIFSDDPSNRNICEYLIKNYRSIIIYCKSQKEGRVINELMNELQKGCSKYLDCHTSPKERKNMLKEYKIGNLPFIVNVEILVEGFDAPITNGVCLMHMPKSSTKVIQIIGRALRLYKNKLVANVILPFSNREDGKDVNSFIRKIGSNDSRIRKSYWEKNIGGYISLDLITNKENFNEINDVEFKYEMIYENIGTKIIDTQEKVKDFIEHTEKNKIIPSSRDKINIFSDGVYMGRWFHYIKKRIEKDSNIYKKLSENKIIKQELDRFLEYKINKPKNILLNNDEKTLDFVSQVCKNKTIPSKKDINIRFSDGVYMGIWFTNIKRNIKKDSDIYKKLSENKIIKEELDRFLEYKTNKPKDVKTLKKIEKAKEFVEIVKEIKNIPLRDKKNLFSDKTCSGEWFSGIKKNLKKDSDIYKELSKNEIIKEELDRYLNYKTNKPKDIKLLDKFGKSKELIKEINKTQTILSYRDENKFSDNTYMGPWFNTIRQKIKKDSELYKVLSENKIIKEELDKYIKNRENKPKITKISKDEKIEKFIEQVDKTKTIPSSLSKNITFSDGVNMGGWFQHIKSELEKDSDIYKKLSKNEIIKKDLDRYLEKKN